MRLFAEAVLALSVLLSAHELLAQKFEEPTDLGTIHIATPSDRFPAKWYPGVGDGTKIVVAPEVDHPYTAIMQHARPATTGDPPPVIPPVEERVARDRFGRTYQESVSGGEGIDGVMYPVRSSEVHDPVSHCSFHWQVTVGHEPPKDERIAFVTCDVQTLRYKVLDLGSGMMDTSHDGTTTDGDLTVERKHLPTAVVEGIHVGCFTVTDTRLDAAGKQTSSTQETCYSPDLHEITRMGSTDDIDQLTRIRRTDPDPKLFYPPDGYRIEVQSLR